MPRFTARKLAVAAALGLSLQSAAFAQQLQPLVPPPLSVQRLAPQLVAFAGSQLNFQNLVNGLSFGTPVQLTTVLPDGSTQVVTFTPTGQMSPSDIARTLEAARQQLISLGIATPTAEQLGTVLMGGLVPTVLGGTQVAGQLTTQRVPSAAAGATATTGSGATATTSANGVSVQTTPAATPRANTSDSLLAPGATSRSPAPAAPTPAVGATQPQVTAAPVAGAPATTPSTNSFATPSSTPTTPAVTPTPQSAPLRR